MCLHRFGLLALAVGLLAQPAGAATYYWDANGTVISFGTASGTWGSSAYWNTDSTGGAGGSFGIPATTSDQVNFGTASDGLAAGTVTVTGSTQGFASMTFGAAFGTITLSGGTLSGDNYNSRNFGTGTVTINSVTWIIDAKYTSNRTA